MDYTIVMFEHQSQTRVRLAVMTGTNAPGVYFYLPLLSADNVKLNVTISLYDTYKYILPSNCQVCFSFTLEPGWQ